MGRVCLSFDNGPDPVVTPRVLEVLARHRARAWFFVLGHKLDEEGGRALARAIRAAGHSVGNHSYSHQTPLGLDPRPDAVAQEIERTEAILADLWDGPRYFRPFGGGGKLGPHLLSPAAIAYLQRRGYRCVLWSAVPEDWLDPVGWVERALSAADEQEHSLIVLHDVLPAPMEQLDHFLSALAARGHTLTEELPARCVPIWDGVPQVDLSPFCQEPTRTT